MDEPYLNKRGGMTQDHSGYGICGNFISKVEWSVATDVSDLRCVKIDKITEIFPLYN